MKWSFAAAIALVCLVGLALSGPAFAQSNDNDYTPLNSRIKRDRQFPLEPPANFVPAEKMGRVEREQTKTMAMQFSRCLYNRSNEASLALLDKTDFGFSDFKQINLDSERAMRIYGFNDCLGRVADLNNTAVAMRFYPANLRQWLLQAAYMAQYPKGPTWLKPGYVIEPRQYPLSKGNPAVSVPMDFADCVVAADPYDADFLFRTAGGSVDEQDAVTKLTPTLGPCLPQGIQVRLDPATLRTWLGEALWNAAAHSVRAPAEPAQAAH